MKIFWILFLLAFFSFEKKVKISIYKNGGQDESVFETFVIKNNLKENLDALITQSLHFLYSESQLSSLIESYNYFELKNSLGETLKDTNKLKDGDRIYIVPQGEHWVYPSIFVGEKLKYWDPFKNKVLFIETLLKSPKLFKVENFLSKEEIGLFSSQIF